MHNKLFILGNGFDLAHGLPTKYCESENVPLCDKCSPYRDFAHFLGEKYPTVYDDFVTYACGGMLVTSKMWANFEELFANVDDNEIVKLLVKEDGELDGNDEDDKISNHFGSIEARISGQKEIVNQSLTQMMANALCDWILSLDYGDIDKRVIEMFSQKLYEADCLSFNYSHTLENFYDKNDLKIIHIHGFADSYDEKVGSDLVFGHGSDGSSNKDIEDGLLGLFREIVAQSILDEEASDLKMMLRKKVDELIPKLQPILSNASDYNRVYIIGHSFGNVDIPYFEAIVNQLNKKARIIVSYHGTDALATIRKKAIQIFRGFDCRFGDISIETKGNKNSFWNLYWNS